MTALARERLTEMFGDAQRTLTLDVNGGDVIYKGALVCLDANGDAIPGDTLANGAVYAAGIAQSTVDNSAGSDGDKPIQVTAGIGKFINADSIGDADVGKPFFVVDDQTVAKSSSSGTRIAGGFIAQVDSDGVRVLVGPYWSKLAQAVALADAGVSLQKRSVTVGHADLTDADTSQDINIGAALPANARILGVSIHTVTAFSGGSVSALALDIGSSGDADALIDGADLMATVVDGQAATRPLGIAPNKLFASSTQLVARFVSTGDNLVNLTAGTCTIDVLFCVLA